MPGGATRVGKGRRGTLISGGWEGSLLRCNRTMQISRPFGNKVFIGNPLELEMSQSMVALLNFELNLDEGS